MSVCYSVNNTAKALQSASPDEKRIFILHSSCVLEDPDELTAFLNGNERICVCADTAAELRFYSNNSHFGRIRRAAAAILERIGQADVINCDLKDFYSPDAFGLGFLALRGTMPDAKLIFTFFNAGAAEEFAAHASYGSGKHIFLLYFNERYVSSPTGYGKMYADPIPISLFRRKDPSRFRFRQLQDPDSVRTADEVTGKTMLWEEPMNGFSPVLSESGFHLADVKAEKTFTGREGTTAVFRTDDGTKYAVKIFHGGVPLCSGQKLRELAAFEEFLPDSFILPRTLIKNAAGHTVGFTMRYAEGQTLSDIAANRPFDKREALRQMFALVLDARLFGLNPLDLSVMNMLYDPETERLSVIDCDSFETERTTGTARPFFRHPDMPRGGWFREQRFIDYSLAQCVWYLLMTGTSPFASIHGEEKDEMPRNAFPFTVENASEAGREADIKWKNLPVPVRRLFCGTFNFTDIYSPGAFIETLGL